MSNFISIVVVGNLLMLMDARNFIIFQDSMVKLMSFLNKELKLMLSGLANAKNWRLEPDNIHKEHSYSQEEEEKESDC